MEKEKLLKILDEAKSISNALKSLGMCDNGASRNKLKTISVAVGFDLNIYKKRLERFCLKCGKKLHKDQWKFCSNSCAASYNNTNRKQTEATKKKISDKMKLIYPEGPNKNGKSYKKINSYDKVCSVCGENFTVHGHKAKIRRTCSAECKKIASTSRKYQNGSRKTIYFNSKKNGIVVLESSWELMVARLLDYLDVNWCRPAPIVWFDSKNKSHFYYPDFLLIDYNYYIDPKNPYCMSRDIEKMDFLKKKLNMIYGDVYYVIEEISLLLNKPLKSISESVYSINDFISGKHCPDIVDRNCNKN